MRKYFLILLFLLIIPFVFSEQKIVETKVNVTIKGWEENNITYVNVTFRSINEIKEYTKLAKNSDLFDSWDIDFIEEVSCETTDVFKFLNVTRDQCLNGCGGKDCRVEYDKVKQSYDIVVTTQSNKDARIVELQNEKESLQSNVSIIQTNLQNEKDSVNSLNQQAGLIEERLNRWQIGSFIAVAIALIGMHYYHTKKRSGGMPREHKEYGDYPYPQNPQADPFRTYNPNIKEGDKKP